MKKVYEQVLRTTVKGQPKNLWQRLRKALSLCPGGFVLSSPNTAPTPEAVVRFLDYDLVGQYSLMSHILGLIDCIDLKETTHRLPPKAGNGYVTTLQRTDSKGAIELTKLLTTLEGNVLTLKVYRSDFPRLRFATL